MAWTPRSDTGGGNWSVFYRVLARRATKAAAQQQAAIPGATLTATLDAAVLSGQGVLVVASPIAFGTVDSILGAASSAGTGTLLLSGSGSSTLSSATASGSGQLRISSNASITLGSVSVSAVATLRNSGTLTQTLGAATLTAYNLAGLSTPTLAIYSTLGAVPVQFNVTSTDYVAGMFGQLQIATDSGFASIAQDTGAVFIGGDEWARLDALYPFSDPSGTYYARFRMLRDNESGATTVSLPAGGTSTFDASAWSNTVTDTISASAASLATTTGVDKSHYLDISGGGKTFTHNNNDGALAKVSATLPPSHTKFHVEFQLDGSYAGSAGMHCGVFDGTANCDSPASDFNYPGLNTAAPGFSFAVAIGSTQVGAYYNGSTPAWNIGATAAAGDKVILEVDTTAKTVSLYFWDASAGALTNSGAALGSVTLTGSYIPATFYVFCGGYKGTGSVPGSDAGTVNFGGSTFSMTPSTGYDIYA